MLFVVRIEDNEEERVMLERLNKEHRSKLYGKWYAFVKLKTVTKHTQKGDTIKVIQTSYYAVQLYTVYL